MDCAATPSSGDGHEADVISIVHHDILELHILSRLEVLDLVYLSCTSSYFHLLLAQDRFWKDICISTWSSVDHPCVLQLISSFPKGFHGFFYDSFPLLRVSKQPKNSSCRSMPSNLVSVVDIWYQNKSIFSRVVAIETGSEWFLQSRFRLDLLDLKEVITTDIKIPRWDEDENPWQGDIEESLTLSWIIIDPASKRAANFSSLKPVSVERQWLTGEIWIKYATILVCARLGYVECEILVMCEGWMQGKLYVTEACLRVEDMDNQHLNGKDSLEALVNAIEFGKRGGTKESGSKNYQEYMATKRARRAKRVSRERVLEMACIAGISVFVAISFSYLAGRL